MPLLARLSLCALLALAVAGCGNKHEVHTEGEIESIYLDLGDLNYQVQISRALNPADVEDMAYLRGLPAGAEEPDGSKETYFGVFLRVQNESESESITPARNFEIVDSQEKVYRPISLSTENNAFAYDPQPLAPGELLPHPDSVLAESQVQGALLLFKITYESLNNRPLEFIIRGQEGEAVVDLDI